ncbi:MAG: tautomerase family protein [Xanthobacteraceae bacterium]|jgi:phenylpyruvate tautomerase PptA (4-oxalocrotonate tautomerase family)
MPLARIDLRRGKSPAEKKAICDGIYRAMTESFGVPQNDRFMIVNEHDAENFVHAESYLGIAHTEGLVIIQITANDTRGTEQKQAFFARVAALLAADPGLRKEDVFINLVEVKKENWSFGNGIAQYV